MVGERGMRLRKEGMIVGVRLENAHHTRIQTHNKGCYQPINNNPTIDTKTNDDAA